MRKSSNDTLRKCEKIFSLFDDMAPRPFTIYPRPKSGQRSQDSSITKKMADTIGGQQRGGNRFNFSRRMSSTSKNPLNSTSKSKSILSNNSSTSSFKSGNYVSPYNQQTRLDRIMQLKVPKPSPSNKDLFYRNKLQRSFSSIASECSDKQNNDRANKKLTRLDKIMQLKISKPNVGSTLARYEAPKGPKAPVREKRESSVLELKRSKQIIQKIRKQEEREDMLWKHFERERELQIKNKKKETETRQKEERRAEKQVESLVSKQILRMAEEKEREVRKRKIFSTYIFPS